MFKLFKNKSTDTTKTQVKNIEIKPDQQKQKQNAIKTAQNQIEKFDQCVEKYELKIENLQAQIFQHIKNGQKKKAMHKLKEQKEYSNLCERLENQRQAMSRLVIKLESAISNNESVQAIQDANLVLKDQQKINDELQDELLNFEEIQQVQQETDDQWERIANQGVDQDELETQFQSLLLDKQDEVTNQKLNNQQYQQQQQQYKKHYNSQQQQQDYQNVNRSYSDNYILN